jgi:tripartite-type tricarboxylate transporter receptor subunit TctC
MSFLILCFMLIILAGCQKTVQEPVQEEKKLEYPTKPVTFIVTYSAGGGTDTGVRVLTKYAEKHLGQSIVVVNKPGGGGEVGLVEIANSPNDGYTIGNFNSAGAMAAALREVKYDPLKSFESICLQVSDPRLFAVRADDDRFKTFEDFLNYAKENPKKLTIGTSGAGTTGHYSIEAFNYFANVEVVPVHFGGAGESRAAFLGGHVDAIAQTVGEVKQMVEEGQAKVVAIAAEERIDVFPDVPTFKEKGIDLVIASNRGIVAPAGTPKEIIDLLANTFKAAMEEPGYIEEMNKLGLPIKYLPPEKFKALTEKEVELYKKLVEVIGK